MKVRLCGSLMNLALLLTLQEGVRTQSGQADKHQIGEHLDVIVIFETVFHVVQELEDVNAVQTRVQKSVHAFKGRLSQVQTIVNCMLERAHLDLADEFLANLGLIVQMLNERVLAGAIRASICVNRWHCWNQKVANK